MKLCSRYTSTLGITLLTLGLLAGAIAPYLATASTPALAALDANTSFFDPQNFGHSPSFTSWQNAILSSAILTMPSALNNQSLAMNLL